MSKSKIALSNFSNSALKKHFSSIQWPFHNGSITFEINSINSQSEDLKSPPSQWWCPNLKCACFSWPGRQPPPQGLLGLGPTSPPLAGRAPQRRPTTRPPPPSPPIEVSPAMSLREWEASRWQKKYIFWMVSKMRKSAREANNSLTAPWRPSPPLIHAFKCHPPWCRASPQHRRILVSRQNISNLKKTLSNHFHWSSVLPIYGAESLPKSLNGILPCLLRLPGEFTFLPIIGQKSVI